MYPPYWLLHFWLFANMSLKSNIDGCLITCCSIICNIVYCCLSTDLFVAFLFLLLISSYLPDSVAFPFCPPIYLPSFCSFTFFKFPLVCHNGCWAIDPSGLSLHLSPLSPKVSHVFSYLSCTLCISLYPHFFQGGNLIPSTFLLLWHLLLLK